MKMQEKNSKRQLVNEYFEKYNLYESTPKIGYNIRKVAHYAASKGCKVSQLTEQEIEQFKIT